MSALIAPSILSADFSRMGEEIKSLEEAGADVLHCDIMDGVFVPNITFGMKMIADIHKNTTLPLDCHLMIVEPEKYIEQFAKAGANYITVHYEACKENIANVLRLIRTVGCKAGVVINPDTDVSVVRPLLPMCDMVLLMSVFPGFGGQKYIPYVTDKIRAVKKMIKECSLPVLVEIDGGVTLENVGMIKQAGVDLIVAGNTVFKAPDRKQVIEELKARE